MATKKTPGRKAPARKVAAVQRHREHKAKTKPEKAHVFEDVPAQPEFDFTARDTSLADLVKAAGPHNTKLPDEICGWPKGSPQYDELLSTSFSKQEQVKQACPEPGPVRSNLAATMEGYYDQYGPERNCGDMVAHILNYRTPEEIESFVCQRTGKSYPELNPGHRRMCCGHVIRGLVNRRDHETLAWLVATSTR